MAVFHLYKFQKISHINTVSSQLCTCLRITLKSSRQFCKGSGILRKCAYGYGSRQNFNGHKQIGKNHINTVDRVPKQRALILHITSGAEKRGGKLVIFPKIIQQHILHIVNADDFSCLVIAQYISQKVI